MTKGAWTIGTYPLDLVRISCLKCGRAGQYRRVTLVDRYGDDMAMPELRHERSATDKFLIRRDYRATPEGQPYDSAAALKAAAVLPLTV